MRTLPRPAWWSAFVLPWLLVMVVSAGLLVRDGTPPAALAVALALKLALTALYVRLAMRDALSVEDLGTGPTPAQLGRRIVMLAGMVAVIVALMQRFPGTGMWWYVMFPVIAAGLALPTALAAAAVATLTAAGIVLPWLLEGRLELMLLIELAIGGGAMAVRRLTLTIEELRAAREALARRAVLEERLRFARDLHDLVGHSLSLIALKSELARRLLPAHPDEAAREVRDVEQGARDALRHVRAAVTGYRQPTLAGELDAARELLAAAGIDAEVRAEAALEAPALDALLAWTVRESITNVVRHSRARRCRIVVARGDGRVRVTVEDDGRGVADAVPAGSGLTGLAERAAALGARLDAGPRPEGGFRVQVEAGEVVTA